MKYATATQFMLGAAAAAVLLGIVIYAFSGGKRKEIAAIDTNAPALPSSTDTKPATKRDPVVPTPPQDTPKISDMTKALLTLDPTKPVPPVGTKIGGGVASGDANSLAAPNTPPATAAERAKQMDKEMEDYRVHRAERMLDDIKTWFKQNPGDPWNYQARLKEVAGPYGSTPAGIEARKILDELKTLPQQPDRMQAAAPEAKDFQLVYDMNLAQLAKDITYDVDNRAKITQPFDRIAYFVELTRNEGDTQYLYVSMDAFTTEVDKIGIPSLASAARFQMNVANMNVFSNVNGVVNGSGLAGGNIEFWPNNYGPPNAANVPDAASDKFDFGDAMGDPVDGYGCMQVHNHDQKQTLFSINHWVAGGAADLGIGNSPNGNPDWTFATNSGTYRAKRLRVLVHLK